MRLSKEYMKKIIMDLWIAVRPLSLTLAIASTTLGILIAYKEGKLFSDNLSMDIVKVILVTLGGVLVQGGTNLVNDFFEGSFKYNRPYTKTYKFLKYERTGFDLSVFALSMAFFGLTALIGLYLMYVTKPQLVYVGLAGIIGGYAYTGEPVVYKKRGLGALLSFVLMGPLMVLGAYYVFAQQYTLTPVVLALPASLMIPLLMFSNELRDYERDKSLNVRTLVVRAGVKTGRVIFISLLVLSYVMTTVLVMLKELPIGAIFVYLTIPIAISAYQNVSKAKGRGIPVTNSLHIAFNAITILALILG